MHVFASSFYKRILKKNEKKKKETEKTDGSLGMRKLIHATCKCYASLRSWRYCKRTRNKVFAAEPTSEWRSREENGEKDFASRDKYRLPENLGILNAAHFSHVIDLN